jgi:hypothetical protein
MKPHIIVYAVFVASILFDLATSILCFQQSELAETNLLYRLVGAWSFPIVYLTDAFFLLAVEWLRKYIRWSPTILFILIFAYVKAAITNLQLVLV